MIGVDVEKFAQIGESVQRRHCPTRKILPYGRLSDTEFLRDLGLSHAACFYCFDKSCSYLFESDHNNPPVSLSSIIKAMPIKFLTYRQCL